MIEEQNVLEEMRRVSDVLVCFCVMLSRVLLRSFGFFELLWLLWVCGFWRLQESDKLEKNRRRIHSRTTPDNTGRTPGQ